MVNLSCFEFGVWRFAFINPMVPNLLETFLIRGTGHPCAYPTILMFRELK